MKIAKVKQLSEEWFRLKHARIGGTRFGQVISDRKNELIYELLDERLTDFVMPMDQFVNDDIQFGLDNEDYAVKAYTKKSGIRFSKVGAILSDHSGMHMASPDRVNRKLGIVLEVKCTQHGKTHIKRFFEGVDSSYIPQIINYFSVSDEVREVHWVSYCPFRHERPVVEFIFTPDSTVKVGRDTMTIRAAAQMGVDRIKAMEVELDRMIKEFTF